MTTLPLATCCIDCEQSLRKRGTADNNGRNEIRVTHMHNAKFQLLEIYVSVNQLEFLDNLDWISPMQNARFPLIASTSSAR